MVRSELLSLLLQYKHMQAINADKSKYTSILFKTLPNCEIKDIFGLGTSKDNDW